MIFNYESIFSMTSHCQQLLKKVAHPFDTVSKAPSEWCWPGCRTVTPRDDIARYWYVQCSSRKVTSARILVVKRGFSQICQTAMTSNCVSRDTADRLGLLRHVMLPGRLACAKPSHGPGAHMHSVAACTPSLVYMRAMRTDFDLLKPPIV
jgi:hypothetical protein